MSLVPQLFGATPAPRDVIIDLPATSDSDRRRALVHEGAKIIAFGNDSYFQMFDLTEDPDELHPIVKGDAFTAMLRRYRDFEKTVHDIPPTKCKEDCLNGAYSKKAHKNDGGPDGTAEGEPMKVVPIPCLADNYAYLLVSDETRDAVIIDPSEPDQVIRAIEAEDVKLTGIWNTHHHFDHTGGNEGVAAHYKLTWVSGHASDKGRIAGQTEFLEAGQRFSMGGLGVEVLHIPGHTLGAIAYVVRGRGDTTGPALFTGDTMFHGGCGRLFEGSPAQMHASLRSLVAQGDDARVYPGHEYTQSNLRFAASLEPGNAAIGDALVRASEKRARGEATVGTTIALERATNPFVRAADGEALRVVRAAKDAWKG